MCNDQSSKPYRPNAGVMLFNRQGKVWVGQRKDMPKITMPHPWQMPQGGIDKGEDPFKAAVRELREETSVVSAKLITPAKNWLEYDFPADLSKKLLKGKYRGQRQQWYAMLFVGSDTEIDIHTPDNGRHKAEFCEWRWEKLENLPDLIVPFKRDIYLELVSQFANIPKNILQGNISSS